MHSNMCLLIFAFYKIILFDLEPMSIYVVTPNAFASVCALRADKEVEERDYTVAK